MQGESILQMASGIFFSLTIFVKTFFQALGIMPAPCEAPLLYTLGALDSRFGISEDEVRQATQQAEALWESTSGKNLFEYHAESGLQVRFVYDERQEKTQAEQELQSRLESLPVEESESEAKAHIAEYEAARGQYEKKLALYKRSADDYNDRVERINKKGGATPDQQDDLREEYQALQKQFEELEVARKKVNRLGATTNQYIEENRTLVETYNQEVTTFQEQYGGDGEVFDQGVYTGTDITIYQYEDTPRLVLVLAHEMGHALGIEHLEEPEAVMYYLMRDQDIANMHLSEADKKALEYICQRPKFPWQQ